MAKIRSNAFIRKRCSATFLDHVFVRLNGAGDATPTSLLTPLTSSGLYFEKIGDYKRAAKEYQSAYTKSEIGDLTKNYILDRAEALKSRKEEPKQEIEETTPMETPTEIPAEAPKKDE